LKQTHIILIQPFFLQNTILLPVFNQLHYANPSMGKESKYAEATGWLWYGLELSYFEGRQSIHLFLSVGKTKIPLIYAASFRLCQHCA
jgi:hypothetical protein